MQVGKEKKQDCSFRNDFTPLCYPKYTRHLLPDRCCQNLCKRKCRKLPENAEKEKKEIRLDKSRFDWDTNAPP